MNDCPRLRHGTIISRADGEGMVAMVGSKCVDIDVVEGSRDTLLELKRYLDGRHSISAIAQALGAEEPDVAAVVDQFNSAGLLANPVRTASIPADLFLHRVEETVTMWRRQMNCHALFGALHKGSVRREVFDGLFIETFHFVRSAARHIGTAVSCATREEWRRLLADYLVEERGHEALILETLTGLGYDPKAIRASHPVIGTASLIAILCGTARRSTLGYLLCMRLIEGQPETLRQAVADLRAIADVYGVPQHVLDPVVRHAMLDEEGGHCGLLATALSEQGDIAAEEAAIALNCMHDLKHAFDQHYDQLLAYYRNPTSYIPRMPIDYFCL